MDSSNITLFINDVAPLVVKTNIAIQRVNGSKKVCDNQSRFIASPYISKLKHHSNAKQEFCGNLLTVVKSHTQFRVDFSSASFTADKINVDLPVQCHQRVGEMTFAQNDFPVMCNDNIKLYSKMQKEKITPLARYVAFT